MTKKDGTVGKGFDKLIEEVKESKGIKCIKFTVGSGGLVTNAAVVTVDSLLN